MSSPSWIAKMAGLRWFWALLVVIWAAVLWYLSSYSHPAMGPSFPLKDKLEHCLYFAAGSGAFLLALRGVRWMSLPFSQAAFTGMIFAGIVGAIDEFHQTFTPGRSGNDPGDWLADITGGCLAAALLRLVLKRWSRSAL